MKSVLMCLYFKLFYLFIDIYVCIISKVKISFDLKHNLIFSILKCYNT